MSELFVCWLDFERDRNIHGRPYAYLADFPVRLGVELVAPLGVHGKLQVGKVVKVETPNALPSLKYAICPYSYRRVRLPNALFSRDLGGLFYDEKHLTAYGNFYRSDLPQGDLSACGVDRLVCFGVDFPSGVRVPVQTFPSLVTDDPLSSLADTELFHSVFSFLASSVGSVLLADENGARSVSLLSYFLYRLCGVSLGDIYRDELLFKRTLTSSDKQNVKFPANMLFPAEEGFLRFDKEFRSRYGGVEEYLRSLSLTEYEIERLKLRMTRIETVY